MANIPVIDDDNLYLYWPFDEATGARADSSSNGFDLDKLESELGAYPAGVPAEVNNGIRYYDDPEIEYNYLKNCDLFSSVMPATEAPSSYKIEMYFKIVDTTEDIYNNIHLIIAFSSDSLYINHITVGSSYKTVEEETFKTIFINRWNTFIYSAALNSDMHRLEIISYDGLYEQVYLDGVLIYENLEIGDPSMFFGGQAFLDITYPEAGIRGSYIIIDEVKIGPFLDPVTPPRLNLYSMIHKPLPLSSLIGT